MGNSVTMILVDAGRLKCIYQGLMLANIDMYCEYLVEIWCIWNNINLIISYLYCQYYTSDIVGTVCAKLLIDDTINHRPIPIPIPRF